MKVNRMQMVVKFKAHELFGFEPFARMVCDAAEIVCEFQD